MLRSDDEFKREMALRYLQYCGMDIKELTPEAWNCFKCIDVKIYVIPLLKRDYKNGVNSGILRSRYRMSYYQIKRRLEVENWKGTRNSKTPKK